MNTDLDLLLLAEAVDYLDKLANAKRKSLQDPTRSMDAYARNKARDIRSRRAAERKNRSIPVLGGTPDLSGLWSR